MGPAGPVLRLSRSTDAPCPAHESLALCTAAHVGRANSCCTSWNQGGRKAAIRKTGRQAPERWPFAWSPRGSWSRQDCCLQQAVLVLDHVEAQLARACPVTSLRKPRVCVASASLHPVLRLFSLSPPWSPSFSAARVNRPEQTTLSTSRTSCFRSSLRCYPRGSSTPAELWLNWTPLAESPPSFSTKQTKVCTNLLPGNTEHVHP